VPSAISLPKLDGQPVRDAHDDFHVVLDDNDPDRSRMRNIRSAMRPVSDGLMPAVGSSSSSSLGSSAIASATSSTR